MAARVPVLTTLLLLAAGPALADSPDSSIERRVGAGVSAGVTHLGTASGRSFDLALEVAIGPAASLRLEAGEVRFADFGRRDRRASAGLTLDLTTPLWLSSALSLTPFVEGAAGFTGTEVFGDHDWRPHLQAGGGLRLALGSRLSISGRVQAGVQRSPEALAVAVDTADTITPPLGGGDRERYTRWQLAGLLRF